MASPPSDGSQSWDKWGPVATPAPILIPAGLPLSIFSTLWKLVPGTDFLARRNRNPLRGGLVGALNERSFQMAEDTSDDRTGDRKAPDGGRAQGGGAPDAGSPGGMGGSGVEGATGGKGPPGGLSPVQDEED
jgi:hypothetical protein